MKFGKSTNFVPYYKFYQLLAINSITNTFGGNIEDKEQKNNS